jgi:hypothetical protein
MQAVKANGVLSDWLQIKTGVPQGTILGPLLFLLYVNDLPDYVDCDYAQYADDTLIFCAHKIASSAAEKLETNCSKMIEYFNSHKLSVNVDKIDYLFIPCSRNVQPPTIIISGTQIKPSTEIKYLGVILDDKLKFESQVKTIVIKMAIGIRALTCIASQISLKCRIQLLHAIILSHFNYSAILLL